MKITEHVSWHKRMKKIVYRFISILVAALVLTAVIYPGPVRTSEADSGFQIDFIDGGHRVLPGHVL